MMIISAKQRREREGMRKIPATGKGQPSQKFKHGPSKVYDWTHWPSMGLPSMKYPCLANL